MISQQRWNVEAMPHYVLCLGSGWDNVSKRFYEKRIYLFVLPVEILGVCQCIQK